MKIKFQLFFLLLCFNCFAQGSLTHFTLYFETGKSTLNRKQRRQVEEYCKSVERLENFKRGIGIIGYTDTIGTSAVNDSLSIHRARALGNYIKELRSDIPINFYIGKRDSLHLTFPAEKQRKAEVIIGLLCGNMEDDPNTFYGLDNIYILPKYLVPKTDIAIFNKIHFSITPYYRAAQMIERNINAVDTENNLIKVISMGDICVKDDWQAWHGYDVYIRILGKPKPD